MNKKLKVAVATVAALAVFGGGGAAIAVATTGSTQSAPTTTTTTAPAEVQSESIEIPAETVSSTTEPPKPAGVPAEVVKAKQQKLLDAGYWLPSVDGKLGQGTQQAVLAFQKVNGMKRSGALDDATLKAIDTVTRPAAASTAGAVIEVDKKRQVIFFARDGKVQWAINTSTGTEKAYVTKGNKGFAHTPTGTFAVNRSVDGVDKGPLGDLYRPRYFTNNGIAVHGSGSIPAYPASHGCARVSNKAMDFIWANNLMPKGASVWVYENPSATPFAGGNITFTPTTTTVAPTTTTPPTTKAPVTTTAAPVTTTTAAPVTTTTAP